MFFAFNAVMWALVAMFGAMSLHPFLAFVGFLMTVINLGIIAYFINTNELKD